MDHQQISAGSAKSAEMFAGLIQSKDAAVKAIDPQDPLYGQKVEGALNQWKEETLTPALDKFREGFTTQKAQDFAEHQIELTRTHMFNQAAADTATAAGIGIQNSIRTTTNVATNTALRDPSSVPAQLDLIEHAITGMVQSSPIKGVRGAAVQTEILEKSREQIVKAGAIGAIQKSADPEAAAQEWVGKYPQYINGAEAIQLAANARQQIRAGRTDQVYADHMQKVQVQDRSDQAETGYLKKLFSDDPREKASVTTKSIVNDPNLTKQAKEHFINIVEREMKPAKAGAQSRAAWLDFTKQIGQSGEDDAQKIKGQLDDAYGRGTLTKDDWKELRQDLERAGTPEGNALQKDRNYTFGKFERSIDIARGPRGDSMPSALGQQNVARAMADAKTQEEVMRRAGKNPRDIYRYDSPDFFFTAKNLQKYQASMKDITDYDAALRKGEPVGTPTTAAPPRAPLPSNQPATFAQRFGFDAAATVNSKADFDKLPAGAEFVGDNGKRYRKP